MGGGEAVCVVVEAMGVRSEVRVQALLHTHHVTSGKFLNPSEPQHPWLRSGNNGAFLSVYLQADDEVMNVKYLAQDLAHSRYAIKDDQVRAWTWCQ